MQLSNCVKIEATNRPNSQSNESFLKIGISKMIIRNQVSSFKALERDMTEEGEKLLNE